MSIWIGLSICLGLYAGFVATHERYRWANAKTDWYMYLVVALVGAAMVLVGWPFVAATAGLSALIWSLVLLIGSLTLLHLTDLQIVIDELVYLVYVTVVGFVIYATATVPYATSVLVVTGGLLALSVVPLLVMWVLPRWIRFVYYVLFALCNGYLLVTLFKDDLVTAIVSAPVSVLGGLEAAVLGFSLYLYFVYMVIIGCVFLGNAYSFLDMVRDLPAQFTNHQYRPYQLLGAMALTLLILFSITWLGGSVALAVITATTGLYWARRFQRGRVLYEV